MVGGVLGSPDGLLLCDKDGDKDGDALNGSPYTSNSRIIMC